MLKEARDKAAKELKVKRVSLGGVKDKGLKDALRETYLMGAKHKAEVENYYLNFARQVLDYIVKRE